MNMQFNAHVVYSKTDLLALNCNGTHPASCTVGTGSFPRVKWARRNVNHTPHLVQRLKKE